MMVANLRWSRWLVIGLVALLLFAYAAPWLKGSGASLTFGGYDLAEWVSLHPEVRGGNPALLPTLLLRLPLTCAALLLALLPVRFRSSWVDAIRIAAIFLLVLAQLPPLEFLTVAQGDINYQQQFTLALVSLLGGAIGLFVPLGRARPVAAFLIALLGIGVSIVGLREALRLADNFHIPITSALGGTLTAFMFALIAALALLNRSQNQKE